VHPHSRLAPTGLFALLLVFIVAAFLGALSVWHKLYGTAFVVLFLADVIGFHR